MKLIEKVMRLLPGRGQHSKPAARDQAGEVEDFLYWPAHLKRDIGLVDQEFGLDEARRRHIYIGHHKF